jgi:hypothetical protein
MRICTQALNLTIAAILLLTLLPGAPTIATPPEPPPPPSNGDVPETHFGGANVPSAPSVVQAPVDSTTQARLDATLDQLPLYFVENQGQTDEQVAYYVQGSDKTVYFTSEGVTFALTAPLTPTLSQRARERIPYDSPLPLEEASEARERWAVKLDFVGANPDVRPVGEEQTEAIISYFKGPQEQWHTGLPTYSRIVYRDLWPGIDLVYYGTVNQLKYEFVVQPGADPAQIRLRYRGATDVALNAAGQLEVSTPLGGFTDDTPVAYQEIGGQRVDVKMAYRLSPIAGRVSHVVYHDTQYAIRNTQYAFQIASYDPTLPLILDPAVLVYCGYIGGASGDYGYGIAVDGAGNAYVTGSTYSDETTFPVVGGPDLTFNSSTDAFVAKVRVDGAGLVYCGYIGGAGVDIGHAIAVDGAGNAYVTGQTKSDETTFPVVGGPDLTFNDDEYEYDAFVAKVHSDGASLVYCGYIGGASGDYGYGIAVDGAGNAYVTGETNSDETTFPVVGGPDLTFNDDTYMDAFVAKVHSDGASLVYCGYIGGADGDQGNGIAVDGAGNAYVTGETRSDETTFPVVGGPDLTNNAEADADAFVAKVGEGEPTPGLSYTGPRYLPTSGSFQGQQIMVDEIDGIISVGDHVHLQLPFTNRSGQTISGATVVFKGVSARHLRPDVWLARGGLDSWHNTQGGMSYNLGTIRNGETVFADIWIYIEGWSSQMTAYAET